ncbi:MAG: DNA polymerase III subunit delta [Pseudomonadota bacterium]
MPEIDYKELKNHIKDANKSSFSPVYLIHGEELLCKTALDELLKALLPDSSDSSLLTENLNFDIIDGVNENIFDAVERANTFSFMPGRKVITFTDSNLFYSKETNASLLEKAKEYYVKKDMKKASKVFTNVMSLLGLSFDDVDKANRSKSLGIDDTGSDDSWFDDIISYCLGNNVSVSESIDSASFFLKAIDKGFPEKNHMVVTAQFVDKRLSLYKSLKEKGMIINCQIPKGDSRNEKSARENIIRERINEVLIKSGKTIDNDAYLAVYEMTGFDLRTLLNNVEKLINYTDKRNKITVRDVETVLKRTKLDPIYELTNAVSDKNVADSLFFLDSLLYSGIHPLQALSAIINQIRKIICIKGFANSSYGKAWETGFPYPRFVSVTMPAIEKYEDALLNHIESWDSLLAEDQYADTVSDPKKKNTKKKSKPGTDLLIAKNSKSPYPLWGLIKKSEKFSMDELFFAFECLKDADLHLKSSGHNPKTVLENVILNICRRS